MFLVLWGMVVGVGVDILETDRFRRILDRYGFPFASRHFTEQEIEQCRAAPVPYRRFAEGFAGKEAVLKALRLQWEGGLFWKEIAVLEEHHPPSVGVELAGQARDRAEQIKVGRIYLSLSCSSEYVVALAVATSDLGYRAI